MEEPKKRFQETPKVTETITFRTTLEKKMRLIRDAMEKGMPLGTHCEEVISNVEDTFGKENTEQNNQMKKFSEMLEELLERNSALQEQIKILTDQPKPITEIGAKLVKEKKEEIIQRSALENVQDENNKQSLIELISAVIPEIKEREKFITRFKKMFDHRVKIGKDKIEAETIYNCIKYCVEWGAFFDAG